jgi:hypothetical protein
VALYQPWRRRIDRQRAQLVSYDVINERDIQLETLENPFDCPDPHSREDIECHPAGPRTVDVAGKM